jgi:hypothetical protein
MICPNCNKELKNEGITHTFGTKYEKQIHGSFGIKYKCEWCDFEMMEDIPKSDKRDFVGNE